MQAVLELWAGTPHKDRMAKPGVGIDCIHFVSKVLTAAGVLPDFTLPYYHTGMGIGRGNNIMERIFMDCTHARKLGHDDTVADFDILIWSVGLQSNHCGIYLGGQAWHVQARDVVKGVPFADVAEDLQSILRLTAPGFTKRPETVKIMDYRQ